MVRRFALVWGLVLGSLAGGVEGAFADAVVLDDQRSLFVRNESCSNPCPVELTKVPPFLAAPFDDIIFGPLFNDWSSSQSSTVAGDEMEGVGFTDVFTSIGEGRSRFDVRFSLSEGHAFAFSGEIEAEGNAGALAQLTDENTAVPFFLYTAGPLAGGPLNQPMDETGVLPPRPVPLAGRGRGAALAGPGRGRGLVVRTRDTGTRRPLAAVRGHPRRCRSASPSTLIAFGSRRCGAADEPTRPDPR